MIRRKLYLPVLGKGSYIKKILSLFGSSLIGYWPLNDATGAVVDHSPLGANLSVINAPTYGEPGIGDGNTSCFFDGVNDELGGAPAAMVAAYNSEEGAMMGWIKPANVGVWTDNVSRPILWAYASDGGIMFRKTELAGTNKMIAGYPDIYNLSAPVTASIDWMHYAVTWSASGNFVKFYLNGAEIATSVYGAHVATLAGFYISEVWHGWIAHVIFLNRAATPAEIARTARK